MVNQKEVTKVHAAKVVVPLRWYDMSEADRVAGMINTLRYTKKMTKEQGKGYMACLKNALTKNDNQTVFNLQEALVDKYYGRNNPDYVYCCVMDYCKSAKTMFGSYFGFSLGSAWENYLGAVNVTASMDDFQLSRKLNTRSEEFFKYMPFLKMDVGHLGLSNGHCCEDCDGDETQYRQYRLDARLKELSEKLNKVQVV